MVDKFLWHYTFSRSQQVCLFLSLVFCLILLYFLKCQYLFTYHQAFCLFRSTHQTDKIGLFTWWWRRYRKRSHYRRRRNTIHAADRIASLRVLWVTAVSLYMATLKKTISSFEHVNMEGISNLKATYKFAVSIYLHHVKKNS